MKLFLEKVVEGHLRNNAFSGLRILAIFSQSIIFFETHCIFLYLISRKGLSLQPPVCPTEGFLQSHLEAHVASLESFHGQQSFYLGLSQEIKFPTLPSLTLLYHSSLVADRLSSDSGHSRSSTSVLFFVFKEENG